MNRIITAIAVASAVLAAPSVAQTYPSKPIRIVLPYSGGTAPDIVARMVAEKFRESMGQPVTVDGRPGGNGFIAMDAIKRGTPDGYDLALIDNGPLTINPSLFKKLPYDPEHDVVPVSLIFYAPFLVTVAEGGATPTLRQLIAAARATPGKVAYGTPGVGTVQHLVAAMMEFGTGTQMVHVPFKDLGQMLTAVGTGDVAWTLTTVASSRPLVQAKKLRLLAVAAKTRLATHPDLPTVEEAGGPAGYDVRGWIALFVPRGTPGAVIARLNQEVQNMVAQKDVKERFQTFGLEAAGSTPAELAELVRSDTRRLGDIVKRTGAAAD
jgi:tripartite-type tricarboxylate transporter receptor subunit TctC